MLKIGFADYYLNNWHCDHYPGFLRDVITRDGIDAAVTHALGIRDEHYQIQVIADDVTPFATSTSETGAINVCHRRDGFIQSEPDDQEVQRAGEGLQQIYK